MEKAVAIVPMVALRQEKCHKSEMKSQILYGETMDLLETKAEWSFIKMHFDNCEGWVSSQQIRTISEEEWTKSNKKTVPYPYVPAVTKHGKMLLSIGSEIETSETENSTKNLIFSEKIKQTAEQFLNVPFLHGGRSFFGVDAGAFVQLMYKAHGIVLPRFPHQQSELGNPLTFVEESEIGDLAFFEDTEGKIHHAGIMLENQKIIHCFGKIRIDELDSTGIFNKDENKHTHKLRFIKRLNQ